MTGLSFAMPYFGNKVDYRIEATGSYFKTKLAETKKILLIITLLSGVAFPSVYAQENLFLVGDTVEIGEVLISPSVPEGSSGYKVLYIDNDMLNSAVSASIASALNINTPLYIKSYGAGGTATSSFRGMGPNHTQIVWEGMRIDNPMTGQTDLSTMMTALIDNIAIYNGGTPMGFGNRGPGGTVSFQSKPVWGDRISAEYTQNIGSFSNYMETVDITAGKNNINYRLRAYLQDNKNDYKYFDQSGDNMDVLNREGAAFKTRGMLHEINYKNKTVVYGARLWYNFSDRDLPGSVAYQTVAGNEQQTDESIRGIISFHNYKKKGDLEGQLGYSSDWMHYTNKSFLINSRNQVKAINARLSGIYRFSESSILKLGFDYRSTGVNTNNYEQATDRKQTAFEINYSYLIRERLGLFASVNQELMNGEFLRVSPSAGFDLRIFKGGDYHIKGSAGLSNHLPTLNDLFWLPGGNPDLRTEKAGNSEITFSYKDKLFKILTLDGSITAYRSLIEDMILWVPVSDFVWTPENVARVVSNGFEIDQQLSYSVGKHGLKLIGSYYYTDVSRQNALTSEDNTVGKQLIYVPKNMSSLSVIYKYEEFMFIWRSSYTGKRFITEDNSESLPSYWLNSVSIEDSFNIKAADFGARFTINNIFDKDYQSVDSYPMPWRTYMFSISIKFSSK